jgi:DNA topoisomerase-3
VADIRQLLQQRVLIRPLRIEGGGEVILTLTATGQLCEIPLPRKSQQVGGRRQRPAKGKSFRGRSKSGRGRAPAEPAAVGEPESDSRSALGTCPVCGAEVVERPKSFSCNGGQCRFVIWKTIAGKRITARTAKTLLDRGETSRLEGFQSKAGKAFSASLKLIDGQVKFVFEGG